MILVDSCVLIDIFTEDADWFEWSASATRAQIANGEDLIINPVIYSEISIDFDTPAELDSVLNAIRVSIQEIPREALFDAARVFTKYRKNSGAKTSTMPDFYIGAHAKAAGAEVLTRDVRRFRTYFPEVMLISP
ncbi:type II toxin-antitoxin system VapC family toxin [Microbulbifer sp.]|uniref:type II toxin-antitoxin system VapC family toxin n=1 Tax=Microbulbifer sp. TaxID=1908541 RepID=UPI003F377CDB